jgi:hypothetical protein
VNVNVLTLLIGYTIYKPFLVLGGFGLFARYFKGTSLEVVVCEGLVGSISNKEFLNVCKLVSINLG